MMKLLSLIKGLEVKKIIGNTDIEINDVVNKSNQVTNKSLFICIKGKNIDSHNLVNDIKKYGAVAVVCEEILETDLTQIIVNNSRKALSLIANNFYNNTNYIEKEAVGYRHFSKYPEKVLFPFGFGLSYSKFSYEVIKNKNYVEARVSNDSSITGNEIVQVYRKRNDFIELVDFVKVALNPHETKIINFDKDINDGDSIFVGSSSIHLIEAC